jgi:hypothetical protein
MKPLTAAALACQEATLESVLHASGAHAWTPQMIEAHKQSELEKAPHVDIAYYFVTPFRVVFFGSTILAAVSVLGLIVCTFCAMIGYLGSLSGISEASTLLAFAKYAVLACAVSLVCSVFVAGCCFTVQDREVKGPAKWVQMSYDNAVGRVPIPNEALALLNAARAYKPDMHVILHVLFQDRVVLDPILEIDGHYVLVWDQDAKIIQPK